MIISVDCDKKYQPDICGNKQEKIERVCSMSACEGRLIEVCVVSIIEYQRERERRAAAGMSVFLGFWIASVSVDDL